jgi:ABC-type branched-subunit amino acid transport system permease subunit
VALAAGAILAGLVSVLISLPSLRLRGDYLVLATMAFQIVLQSVFNNWREATGGENGIQGIPPLALAGLTTTDPVFQLLALASAAAAAAWICGRVGNSPFGRILKAFRDDEIAAESLGREAGPPRMKVFALSACLSACAGSLFAIRQSYIDPSSFSIEDSVLILAMVVIGGAGNLKGPMAGAALLGVVPEVLRFVGIDAAKAGEVRQILFGICLYVVLLIRPQGLIGDYKLR